LKQIATIISTLAVIFAETMLLDLDYIATNNFRIAWVALLMLITIAVGFRFYQAFSKK